MSEATNLIFIFGAQYLYLAIIIIASIWFFTQPKPRQREILLITCICLPLALIIFEIAARIYYNPRPFVLGHFAPLVAHKADNGFPSHHMLLASLIPAIIFLFDRRASLSLLILALFVGFSRVYAGVHHVIDIAGSLFIAVSAVTLSYFFVKYLKSRKLRIFGRDSGR
ncbi:MAG: phosphatase PAP2 family protein [Candidatus Omnitrophica bacterium]|nr:phosphatase PAP2 family protein [Candidatus Omnitrophota bacterium]